MQEDAHQQVGADQDVGEAEDVFSQVVDLQQVEKILQAGIEDRVHGGEQGGKDGNDRQGDEHPAHHGHDGAFGRVAAFRAFLAELSGERQRLGEHVPDQLEKARDIVEQPVPDPASPEVGDDEDAHQEEGQEVGKDGGHRFRG